MIKKLLFFLFTMFVSMNMMADVVLTPGTNASDCTVNGFDGVKVGTSRKTGDMTITVPANAISLEFYAAAWKGANNLDLIVFIDSNEPDTLVILADDGISNNPPFTLSSDDIESFKQTISLDTIDTEITLTLTASKRFVVWSASCEVYSGTPTDIFQVSTTNKPSKVFENQQVIIKIDDKIYNVFGQRLR